MKMYFLILLLVSGLSSTCTLFGSSVDYQLKGFDLKEVIKIETTINGLSDSSMHVDKKLIATVEAFVTRLANGDNLDLLMSNNWSFIYHEDNRCDGSTDGYSDKLTKSRIDEKIKIQIINDGEGWVCDKKESSRFMLEFSLIKQVKNWDRFIIAEYSDQKEMVFYILGAGESDYLKIHYNIFDDEFLIVKLEYRSEDPG